MQPPQGLVCQWALYVTSGAAGRSGRGEAWTHSPTVWGPLTPAQTLWPVGGSQECPSSPGGTLDRQGGLGSGRAQGGLSSRHQRGPAEVAPG